MDVVYKVRLPGDSLQITMEVDGYGDFAFEEIMITQDSLAFQWTPSFTLNCAMFRLPTGVYQEACKDPWGGFGGIIMAPQGSDVNAIELHNETIGSSEYLGISSVKLRKWCLQARLQAPKGQFAPIVAPFAQCTRPTRFLRASRTYICPGRVGPYFK